MSEIRYRHWQPGDDEGVLRILEPLGWCPPERYAAKFDDAGLRPEDVLIAERDGQIVGHLMLPHRRLRFGGATLPLGGVGMVVVDPTARGAGIGAQLLDRALAHHRAAGNALAALFSMPSLTPAYGMYRRRGFVPIAQRVILHLPLSTLAARGTGLRARPATSADRPAIVRLIETWAETHRGVSVEAAAAPVAGQMVVVRPDGEVVGLLEIVEQPEGRAARRLVTAPRIASAAVLAAVAAGEAGETLALVTNPGSRVHRELLPLAARAQEEETQLMLAVLSLRRVVAGLALEVAAQLRTAGAAPVEAGLTLAETGERLRLEWSGAVLTVEGAPAVGDAPATLTAEQVATGLAGRTPAPPSPALAPLWTALFPSRDLEMRLVSCW